MKFQTIMMDCPWQFSDRNTRGAADRHYKTMSESEILHLPIEKLSAKNCHIYMWTTAAHLEVALALIKTWDFKYKLPIAWVKTKDIETKLENRKPIHENVVATQRIRLQIGLGHYFRHADELCLFATKGKVPALVHNLPNVVFALRTKHSRKPDIVYKFAELLSRGPRLEMFAREVREKWFGWGDEYQGKAIEL